MRLEFPVPVLLQEIPLFRNTNRKVGMEDVWLESVRQLGVFVIFRKEFVAQSVWEKGLRKHIYGTMEISAGLMESV